MQIITDLNEAKTLREPVTAALGYFDGFHLGHQKLLEAVKLSEYKNAVITFRNQPSAFIKREEFKPTMLLSLEDKIAYLEKAGFDYLFLYDFDERIMAMTKEDFVKEYLFESNVRCAVAGFNFTFGKNREGNMENLPEMCAAQGIEVKSIPAVHYGLKVISSTLIRKYLYFGEVSAAAQMLGRYYHLNGHVVRGREIGRTLGFPTANITVDNKIIVPKWGVYETRVTVRGARYKGVTNIGNNPTVEGQTATVETFILNFEEDIYGEDIKIEFVSRIRGEQKFLDLNELKEQIIRDIAFAEHKL